MKKKALPLLLTAAMILSSFAVTASAAPAEDLPDPTGEYSTEYKSSPFYEKLILALDNSNDKTTMEKTLAAALSQEGYMNYSTEGIDADAERANGNIWTGKELRMNSQNTGNTEYTRWAQNVIMDRSGSALYLDCDWCALFTSWCMYQAGYYTEEQLKKYYYSYCADPRIEFDADSWITSFCLDQKKVWYTPLSEKKLEAYDWNTYYNTEKDPYDIPYKPGGLIFFSWDGSGTYFDHQGIVVSYDPDDHVLTYAAGNSEGQVITREMDYDTTEEYYGKPLLKNSDRIMAYAEYDEIKPLEKKEITADAEDITWYKDSSSGVKIQTNSDSKIASVFIDEEYLGSNIESNMLFNEGRLAIGKSELVWLDDGDHTMKLVFDDGVLSIPLTIGDKKPITAENTSITWDRSEDSVIVRTDSGSDTVAVSIGGTPVGTEETEGITLENGTVTLSREFADSVFTDGENAMELVFADGEIGISVFVTHKEKEAESSDTSEPEGSDVSDSSDEESQPESSDVSESTDTEDSSEPESSAASEASETEDPDTDNSSEPEGSVVSEDTSEPESSEPSENTDTDDTDDSGSTNNDDNNNTPETGDQYPFVMLISVMVSGCVAVLAAKKRTQKR